jgi:crossover junction endonuclease MUS81
MSTARVKLWVDHRESLALKDLLQKHDPELTNLSIGDISITIDDRPLMIIERKTLMDLAASIKDGRYKNQKANLLDSVVSVYYIVEGSFDFSEDEDLLMNGISKKAMLSAILNTMIRDGIQVFFTKNVTETSMLVQSIVRRVREDPEKYLSHSQSSTSKVILKAKPKIRSKEDCYECQLCQLPDVSQKTAKAIMKKYPSWNELYTSLSFLSDDEKLKVLKEIKIEESQRHISDKVAKNLIHYLF